MLLYRLVLLYPAVPVKGSAYIAFFYLLHNHDAVAKYQEPTICAKDYLTNILGDPGATGRDDAIFSGKSLLQELKSPWELILTEPVPEVVEFRPANQRGRLAG